MAQFRTQFLIMWIFFSLSICNKCESLNSLYTASRSLRLWSWCHGLYDGQSGAYDASSAWRSRLPSRLSPLPASWILRTALVMQR